MTKTKIHGATLPDMWVAHEYSSRALLEISRNAPDAKYDGGSVTIDFQLRIFNSGLGQPHRQAKSTLSPEFYTGRGWKKRIIEDACAWLEKEMN